MGTWQSTGYCLKSAGFHPLDDWKHLKPAPWVLLGRRICAFFVRVLFFLPCYLIQCVWDEVNKNHYLQLVLHLDHKVVCASQRAPWAIAAETGGLTCCPSCQSWWLKLCHQLRQCLAKCTVSCDWILCESVLCCRSCWPFSFFLSFLMWYLLSLFIYVFQRNPAALHSRPLCPTF